MTRPTSALVPMRIETTQLTPGEMNTWFIEVCHTERGVRYATKEPKTVWTFERRKEQVWERYDASQSWNTFPVITGGIFEADFSDCFQQMWAAFALDHEGLLGERVGCVTPAKTIASQELFAAALRSHSEGQAIMVG